MARPSTSTVIGPGVQGSYGPTPEESPYLDVARTGSLSLPQRVFQQDIAARSVRTRLVAHSNFHPD